MTSEESNTQLPTKQKDDAGCTSIGCASLFVLFGLAWPFSHIFFGSYEPELLFVPVFIGGPAFVFAHVFGFYSSSKGEGNSLGMKIVWGGSRRLFW